MSVIEHDFGLNERKAARRLTTLLSLDALHEANVRANPLPYLERATERIYQLEKALFEAAAAAEASPDEATSSGTVTVSEAEYRRLVNCRLVVTTCLAELGLSGDGN